MVKKKIEKVIFQEKKIRRKEKKIDGRKTLHDRNIHFFLIFIIEKNVFLFLLYFNLKLFYTCLLCEYQNWIIFISKLHYILIRRFFIESCKEEIAKIVIKSIKK